MVTAQIENQGDRETEEVLQVYIKDCKSPFAVRNYKLCGFKRTTLGAGECRTVEISLSPEAFQVVNEEGERIVDSDEFILYVGISQPDERSCALLGTCPKEISLTLK